MRRRLRLRHGPAVTWPVKRIAGRQLWANIFPSHLPSSLFILFTHPSCPVSRQTVTEYTYTPSPCKRRLTRILLSTHSHSRGRPRGFYQQTRREQMSKVARPPLTPVGSALAGALGAVFANAYVNRSLSGFQCLYHGGSLAMYMCRCGGRRRV